MNDTKLEVSRNTRFFQLNFNVILGILIGVSAVISLRAFGSGKVEAVKKAVKDSCKKDVPEEELMDAVIAAFDCTPDSKVTVAKCEIKCLKESRGTIVGK